MAHERGNKMLGWFLSFINADLSRLTVADRFKLLVDLGAALDVRTDLRAVASPVNPPWFPMLFDAGTKTLTDIQHKLRQMLSKFEARLAKLKGKAKDAKKGGVRSHDYLELTRLHSIPLTVELTLSIEPLILPVLTPELADDGSSSIEHWAKEFLTGSRFDVKASSQGIEAVMMYYFFQTLNGLPCSSLKRCKQCEGWFVVRSSRERFFCSSSCATKNASRKRYAKKSLPPQEHMEELQEGKSD